MAPPRRKCPSGKIARVADDVTNDRENRDRENPFQAEAAQTADI
jgi:hypothetical protein